MLDEGPTPFGPVYLAATPRGLCRVTIPGETLGDLMSWLERKLPRCSVEPRPGYLAREMAALEAFLADGTPLPDVAIDLIGTPFQRSVWDAVLEVPYGETRSYAEIAARIGHPRASRAVGAANAVNPLPLIVPCHRVIGADGSIKGFPGGIITRRSLLEREGYQQPN